MPDWECDYRAAAAGDRTAQDRLLVPILPPLRAYVRMQAGARLRARESVSDVVQSVCREILADLDKVAIPAEPNFRGWVLTVARRKLADKARYHAIRARHREHDLASWHDLEPSLAVVYSRFANPVDAAVAGETQSRLERAMRELPELQRRVIMLVRVMDLSHADAARQLDRTEGATRILLMRALARLAKALASQDSR